MGEFDLLAAAVAVAGLVIGVAHIIRNLQLAKLQRVQEANNKILVEILTELKGLREERKRGKVP